MKGDFEDRIAAIVRPTSTQPKMADRRQSLPRLASRGSFASWLPRGVNSSVAVRAPTSMRASMARRMFFAKGGSSA